MVSYKRLVSLVLAISISGCNSVSDAVSQYPMLSSKSGNGPWQIVTYSGDKVYHQQVVLDSDGVGVKSSSVYISNSSQFIYRDGRPITTYDGKYLYWNIDGLVINRHRQVVQEDQVFVVNRLPMKPGTAMKLRDFYKPSDIVTLAGSDTAG